MSIRFKTAPIHHCILRGIAEYTILKPSSVMLPSVTNDTKAVLPMVWKSLGREVPENMCMSGAEALFPS